LAGALAVDEAMTLGVGEAVTVGVGDAIAVGVDEVVTVGVGLGEVVGVGEFGAGSPEPSQAVRRRANARSETRSGRGGDNRCGWVNGTAAIAASGGDPANVPTKREDGRRRWALAGPGGVLASAARRKVSGDARTPRRRAQRL
jgi:hypothetical protein